MRKSAEEKWSGRKPRNSPRNFSLQKKETVARLSLNSLPPSPLDLIPAASCAKNGGGGKGGSHSIYPFFLPPPPPTHPSSHAAFLASSRSAPSICLVSRGMGQGARCVPPPAREGKRQSGRRPTANTVQHCLLEGNALLEGSTTLFLLHFSFPPLHRILTAKRGGGQE